MSALPTFFLSHGAPTLLIEDHPARDFLRGLASLVLRPQAILLASAHWITELPAASTAVRPQTIHDFYGFPAELYRVQYTAPGAPSVARRAVDLMRQAGLQAVEDAEQGLDHGAWQPLALAWPAADIPVFQLSIQAHRDPAFHAAVGRALAPLREEGVLVIGTGSATHNLGALRRDAGGRVEPWAQAFDDWLADRIEAGDERALLDYRRSAPHAVLAHPTDEHLLPLYIALGAADGAAGRRIHASFSRGTLSMAAFSFG